MAEPSRSPVRSVPFLRRDAHRVEERPTGDVDQTLLDLHDSVVRQLFATGLALHGILAVLPGSAATERLWGLIDETDETICQIRATVAALQPRVAAEERLTRRR